MTTPQFIWEKETGYAACMLTDNNGKTYFGSAQCSEVDRDMMSEKTGCEIALMRATIEALRARRDELKAELRSLNQLYYSVNKSKRYNPTGYMETMLNHQIKFIQDDLNYNKEEITRYQQKLMNYINDKDSFYKRIRHNRKVQNN